MIRALSGTKRNTIAALVILSALFVGATYVAPRLAIRSYLESRGQSFVPLNFLSMNDDAKGYMGRAREIYDGHFPPTDLFLDQGGPMPLNPLPPLLWAPFIFLFRGDMDAAYFLTQFLFAAVLFVLFYALGRITIRDRVWSLALGLVATLTPLARFLSESLFSADRFLNNVVKNFYPLVRTPLDRGFLSRMDDPLLTLPVYLAAVAALFLFWERPTKYRTAGAGIAVGLLFYTYWHYWVYLVIVVGLMAGYALLTRAHDAQRFRMSVWLAVVLALMAVPFVVNSVLFFRSDVAADWLRRLAPEYGHAVRTSGVLKDYLLYLLFAVAVVAAFFKRQRDRAVLFLVFILAMFVGWNVQVATGFLIAPGHWRVTYSPILLLIGFNLGYEAFKGYNRKIVYGGLVLLMALLMVKKTVNAFEFANPGPRVFGNPSVASRPQSYALDRNMVASWRWIEERLPGEPRILSPAFMSSLHLVIYTPARPFLPVYLNTLASTYEMEERFLAALKLFQMPRERFEALIHARESDCPTLAREFDLPDSSCRSLEYYNVRSGVPVYSEYFVEKRVNKDFGAGVDDDRVFKRGFPQAKVDELLARYDRLRPQWRDVAAEFVYYGPLERSLVGAADFSRERDLEPAYKNAGVEIYRIVR